MDKILQLLVVFSLLALASCNTGEVEIATQPAQTSTPKAARTPPSVVVSTQTPHVVPQVTDSPTPTVEQVPESPVPRTIACPGMLCVWRLDRNPPELVSFEGELENIYDYSPPTQRVLHGRFTGRGAGPGNIAVSDLQFLDLNSGTNRQIIAEENIAEAVWAPDGKNLAYVKATPRTYELHWLTEFGEDRSLASDVAFTFSVSPDGGRVAFTRESGYNVTSEPGLYIVDITSGEEWPVSNFDREGTGSISDRPIWSMDGSQIILPVLGKLTQQGFVRAEVGSGTSTLLGLSPSVREIIGRGRIGTNLLWHPDNQHLIGQVYPDMLGSDPEQIYSFELDPPLDLIIAADLIWEGEGELVGWSEPGISIWVKRGLSELIQVPLP